ncbi:MAG: hypothetical protein IT373_09610 [Polyangiaceae bacterium]|nr:hypothetical protein [Polyangiaceae bacterium]
MAQDEDTARSADAAGADDAAGDDDATGGDDAALADARRALAAGVPAEAERILRAVLATRPDEREALHLCGFALYLLDRSAEAEPLCRRAVALYPDDAYGWSGLGLHLVRLGQGDEGFRALERAMELAPDWLDGYWDYLVTCLDRNERARFWRMHPVALARFPGARARLAALAVRARAVLGGE